MYVGWCGYACLSACLNVSLSVCLSVCCLLAGWLAVCLSPAHQRQTVWRAIWGLTERRGVGPESTGQRVCRRLRITDKRHSKHYPRHPQDPPPPHLTPGPADHVAPMNSGPTLMTVSDRLAALASRMWSRVLGAPSPTLTLHFWLHYRPEGLDVKGCEPTMSITFLKLPTGLLAVFVPGNMDTSRDITVPAQGIAGSRPNSTQPTGPCGSENKALGTWMCKVLGSIPRKHFRALHRILGGRHQLEKDFEAFQADCNTHLLVGDGTVEGVKKRLESTVLPLQN